MDNVSADLVDDTLRYLATWAELRDTVNMSLNADPAWAGYPGTVWHDMPAILAGAAHAVRVTLAAGVDPDTLPDDLLALAAAADLHARVQPVLHALVAAWQAQVRCPQHVYGVAKDLEVYGDGAVLVDFDDAVDCPCNQSIGADWAAAWVAALHPTQPSPVPVPGPFPAATSGDPWALPTN